MKSMVVFSLVTRKLVRRWFYSASCLREYWTAILILGSVATYNCQSLYWFKLNFNRHAESTALSKDLYIITNPVNFDVSKTHSFCLSNKKHVNSFPILIIGQAFNDKVPIWYGTAKLWVSLWSLEINRFSFCTRKYYSHVNLEHYSKVKFDREWNIAPWEKADNFDYMYFWILFKMKIQ